MNGEAKNEAVRDRLLALEAVGRLTAEAVVEDAKSKASPLHSCFQWSDKKAAHSFRIQQARDLIASVRVMIVHDSRILAAPCYVRDPDALPKEQGYVQTVSLRDDRERARAAVLNELARAESYLARVQLLATALGVDNEIGDIQERMHALRFKLAA